MGEIQIPPHTRIDNRTEQEKIKDRTEEDNRTGEEKIKEVAYQEFLKKRTLRQQQREKAVAEVKESLEEDKKNKKKSRIKDLIVRTTLITCGVLAGFVIVKARTNDGNIIRQFADKVVEMDNDNINDEWYDDEVVESQRITNQNILENQYDDEWHDDSQEQAKILAK